MRRRITCDICGGSTEIDNSPEFAVPGMGEKELADYRTALVEAKFEEIVRWAYAEGSRDGVRGIEWDTPTVKEALRRWRGESRG